jgi:hypothetical protein
MAKSAKAPAKSPGAEQATGAVPDSEVVPDDEAVPDSEVVPDAEAVSDAGSQAEPAPAASADDLDETKRKFREALDRKKQAHASTAAAGNRGAGKAQGAGGPATSRRQFRRKSG